MFLLLFLNVNSFSARWIELNAIGYTQPQSEIPRSRTGGIIFNLNDSIYYGGGFFDATPGVIPKNDFHRFDISNNQWSDAEIIPFDIVSYNAPSQTFTLNGKGYYCDDQSHTWEFDPILSSWLQRADYPGSARSGFVCFGINNKGYITIGKDSLNNYINTCYEFDPSLNSWTQKANFPANGREGSFVLGFPTGGLVVAGSSNSPFQAFYDCWFYEEASNSWLQKAPLIDTLNGINFGFTLSTMAYCIGDSSVWEFDLVNNLWSPKSNFPQSTNSFYFSGISAGGNGYAINGEYIYKYDPIQDNWSEITSLKFINGWKSLKIGNAAYFYGYKLDLLSMIWTPDTLLNAYWFFSIGNNAYGFRNGSFQSYNTISGLWSIHAVPPTFVNIPEAFSLSGKGYIILNGSDFYEYDPLLNLWQLKSSFPGLTYYDGVSFTYNTKVYYGLGFDINGFGTPDFWCYDQASDTWTHKPDGPSNGGMFYSSIGAIGYSGGGIYVQGTNLADNIFCKYDMSSDTWDFDGYDCSTPRRQRINGFCFIHNGNLYVGGGFPGHSNYSDQINFDMWQYQPNSLTTTYSLPQNLCAGEQYTGTYITSSLLDSSNLFQVVLSDSLGDFTNSTVLSSFNSTSSTGSFNFVIPNGNYYGNGYRLRFDSSAPFDCITSVDSFTIGSALVQSFIGQTTGISQFQTLNYSVLFESGVTYLWNVTNGNIVSGQGTNAVSIQWGNNSSGEIQVITTNGFCSDTLIIPVTIGTTNLLEIENNIIQLKGNIVKNELEIINFNSVNFNFTITDLNGKKLIASKNSLNRINIECLKSGLYNITFDLGNQVLSKRFIKLE